MRSDFHHENDAISNCQHGSIHAASVFDYANTNTAQVRTSIEVLKKLEGRIDNHATFNTMQSPESRGGDDTAARIEAQTIEQIARSKPSWRNWKAGATSYERTGGTVLHSMLKTGHALPLRAEGFCVRESVAVNPQIVRAIWINHDHKRATSANTSRHRTGLSRDLFVSANSPHPHPVHANRRASISPQSRSEHDFDWPQCSSGKGLDWSAVRPQTRIFQVRGANTDRQ